MDQQLRLAHSLTMMVGGWLLVAPLIITFTNSVARANSLIVGVLLMVSTTVQYYVKHHDGVWVNWLHAGLGVWLLFSPFLMHYLGCVFGTANQVIMGSMLLVLATWEEAYEALIRRKWV